MQVPALGATTLRAAREAAIEEQEMHGGDLDHWIEVIRKRRGLS